MQLGKLFPLFLTFSVCEGATGSIYSRKLFKKFFEDEGYNHNVRPVLNVNTVTDVQMLLYVAQVLDMVCVQFGMFSLF